MAKVGGSPTKSDVGGTMAAGLATKTNVGGLVGLGMGTGTKLLASLGVVDLDTVGKALF